MVTLPVNCADVAVKAAPVILFTVMSGVPVNPDARSAVPVTSPVTSPVTLPVKITCHKIHPIE